MDGQELVQVNFQLPASVLDSLAKLAEQLQKLAAAVGGPGRPAGMAEEIAESGAFDQERFRALMEQSKAAGGHPPQAVRSDVMEPVPEPESAGRMPPEGPEEPERTDIPAMSDPEGPETAGQEPDGTEEESAEDIPSVRPEMEEPVPDAPVVQPEPESLIPEAEKVWTEAGEGDLPLPAAQAEELAEIETPLGAGMVVTAQPEPPASRWSSVTEELVTPGPAPLTAEAVSLAFQRDGRRYDNGFPLY